ncbi:MAG: hypothetical protein ACLFV5_08195 [Anaerolineales bacterium]
MKRVALKVYHSMAYGARFGRLRLPTPKRPAYHGGHLSAAYRPYQVKQGAKDTPIQDVRRHHLGNASRRPDASPSGRRLIRQRVAGIYSYLPLGWRPVQNVAEIIRQEIDGIGGEEPSIRDNP